MGAGLAGVGFGTFAVAVGIGILGAGRGACHDRCGQRSPRACACPLWLLRLRMGVFGRRRWGAGILGAGILGAARGARGSDLLLGRFAEFERLEHLVEVVAGCVLIHVLLSLVRLCALAGRCSRLLCHGCWAFWRYPMPNRGH